MTRPVPVLVMLLLAGCSQGLPDGPHERLPDFAGALLWSQPSQLIVQIHYEEGARPHALTLARIEEELVQQTRKSDVTVLAPELIHPPAGSGRPWTITSLRTLHEQTFTLGAPFTYVDGDRAFLHYLFLRGWGELEDERRFVGVATTPPLLVVLPDASRTMLFSVQGPSTIGPPHIAPDAAQAAIAVHELGHALGLVGRGAPETQERRTNEDEDPCACHSRHRDSVMYPGIESVNATRFIQQRDWVQHRFDATDLADIAALRAHDPYR